MNDVIFGTTDFFFKPIDFLLVLGLKGWSMGQKKNNSLLRLRQGHEAILGMVLLKPTAS